MKREGNRTGQYAGSIPERGLEAPGPRPAFRGPVEPPDDHEHANDHHALVYESRDEQLAATIAFVRQGFERGDKRL